MQYGWNSKGTILFESIIVNIYAFVEHSYTATAMYIYIHFKITPCSIIPQKLLEIFSDYAFLWLQDVNITFDEFLRGNLTPNPLRSPYRTRAGSTKQQLTQRSHTESRSVYPITRRQILDSSKLKEFGDDNFKFDENGSKLSKQVENTVGKGEIARYEQFLLFPQCFQKARSPGASKAVIVWEWVI